MRKYEAVFILNAKEELFAASKEKASQQLIESGGTIVNENDMGIKKLTFPIKKEFEGHYLIYDVEIDEKKLPELDKVYKLEDNILKYQFMLAR